MIRFVKGDVGMKPSKILVLLLVIIVVWVLPSSSCCVDCFVLEPTLKRNIGSCFDATSSSSSSNYRSKKIIGGCTWSCGTPYRTQIRTACLYANNSSRDSRHQNEYGEEDQRRKMMGSKTSDGGKTNQDNIEEKSISTVLSSWWMTRLQRTDPLEIRLDATLLSCYVLARFLVYDIATGAKAVPGWNIDDWIRISSAISSSIVLSVWWTVGGLFVTQIFETQFQSYGQKEEVSNDDSTDEIPSYLRMAILTMINGLISVPLWLLTEGYLHFGPPGFDVTDYTSATVLLTTSLGLSCTMIFTKSITRGWT